MSVVYAIDEGETTWAARPETVIEFYLNQLDPVDNPIREGDGFPLYRAERKFGGMKILGQAMVIIDELSEYGDVEKWHIEGDL